MKINARLNTNDINAVIEQIERFKDNLQHKLADLVIELANIGITVAMANTFVEYDEQYINMGDLLEFSKETIMTDDEVTCTLSVTGQVYTKEWKGGSAQVNPLLMAEFGSGFLAKVLDDVPGVGQGTFPGQKHAFDAKGWWWETPDGVKHHSYGEAPTFPMHSASMAMLFEADRIAKEVFK
jgi:hypothetical protein